MRIQLIACSTLMLISACSTIPDTTYKIAWTGTYTPSTKVETFASSTSPSGLMHVDADPRKRAQETTNITARIGEIFGVDLSFTNPSMAQAINYESIWRFPKYILNPHSKQVFNNSVMQQTCDTNKRCFTGWRFDEPWEMVPGTWTLEIWVKDQMVLTQSFNVTVN